MATTLAPSGAARPVRLLRIAIWLSLGLLALRLHTARGLGWGDAEALYASYAWHPQPAYLDHPGLVGFLLDLLGDKGPPSAEAAHAVSACLATLVPWLGGLAARATGVDWERAATSVLALALVPELSVGLFGVSPDLPLAICWLGSLALALWLSRRFDLESRSLSLLVAWLGLGLLLGLGTLSKVSAALLALALIVASLRRDRRRLWQGYGAWTAVACAAIVVSPLVAWELTHDFSMLEHRLVTTQHGAGLSLRNLGKLVGGQLLYVTPPFLIAAWFVARDLYSRRKQDPASSILWWSFSIPGLVLTLLSLWSDRAEPHWVAPALLALGVHAARSQAVSPRLARASLVTGLAVTLLVWTAVKTDVYIRLATSKLGESLGGYRPRYDLTNDLYAWGPGQRLLRDALSKVVSESGQWPVVIGAPHWMLCAQAQVTVGERARVGCHSAEPTDFDRWLPQETWHQANILLLVHDSRYPVDPAREFPTRRVVARWHTQVRRGDQVVRTLRVTRLDRVTGIARGGLSSAQSATR